MNEFDDFLGLCGLDFSGSRFILFRGVSGSGKSTAIRLLAGHHPQFAGLDFRILSGPPFPSSSAASGAHLIIDEILRPRDLRDLFRAIVGARRSLIATHLAPIWFLPLEIWGRRRVFRTDSGVAKLSRYLDRRGVAASEAALLHYEAAFGATYTDIDLILERFPSRKFDESLRRFQRFCRVERTPAISSKIEL